MGISFSGGMIPAGKFLLSVNKPPVWSTAPGSLGDANGGQPYTLNLLAVDPENAPLKFSVVAGGVGCGSIQAGEKDIARIGSRC